MKICWVKILTPVAGGSTDAYLESPPVIIIQEYIFSWVRLLINLGMIFIIIAQSPG